MARRLLEHQLAGRVSEQALNDARTVVSELVNNAYVHGQGRIELQLRLRAGRLRIEVVDQGQGAALQVRRESHRGGGQGLNIVESLSTQWGAFEGTTHVWAELEVGSPEAR